MSAELYRRNAGDCRQRSMQANRSEDKAAWLKLAEECQKLAEEVDAAEATRQGALRRRSTPGQTVRDALLALS
jgi:hypothetical protein